MLRKLNLLIASVLLTVTYGYSQSGLGTIRGSVVDKDSKEAIYDCIVVIKQNGTVKGNTTTAVSYTHLDVYKRQVSIFLISSK